MHLILRYIRRHKMTQVAFARLVGLSPQYVNDLVLGRHVAGRNAAIKIEDGTRGEITVQELLTGRATPKPRRKAVRRKPQGGAPDSGPRSMAAAVGTPVS